MATILLHLAFSVIIPEQNVARNKHYQFIARLFESAHRALTMAAPLVSR
jgi:hypothetical protein